MQKTMRYSHFIIDLILCICLFSAACNRNGKVVSEEPDMTDPTQTYSIVRPDNGSGIEVISEDGSDPLKVREFIQSYPIPEQSFTAKRAKFCNLLDQLKKETESDTVSYETVDSLNYMAIHYLSDLLQDSKSISGGIRHPMLSCKISSDKRLRLYSWDEHIAPGQQSHINVFQYRTDDNRLIAAFQGTGRTHDETDFLTGRIESLHPLFRDGDSVRLYLICYAGSHGNEHLYKGFGCINALHDSLDFTYPAFEGARPFAAVHYSEKETAQAAFDRRHRRVRLQRHPANSSQQDSLCRNYIFDGTHFIADKP